MEEKQGERGLASLSLPNSVNELGEQLGDRLEEAQTRLRELDERVSGFIKRRPTECLLGALAIGFVIGRILKRRG